MTPSPAYRLRPQLPPCAEAFGRRFLEDVHAYRRRSDRLLPLLRARQSDPFLSTLDGPDLLALRLFLEDLARLGWAFDADGGDLVAFPPDAAPSAGVEQHEVKARLRAALVEARNEQLCEPSVRDFLAEMERTRRWGSVRRSVLDLFASPQALAADLAHRLASPEDTRRTLRRGLPRRWHARAGRLRITHRRHALSAGRGRRRGRARQHRTRQRRVRPRSRRPLQPLPP